MYWDQKFNFSLIELPIQMNFHDKLINNVMPKARVGYTGWCYRFLRAPSNLMQNSLLSILTSFKTKSVKKTVGAGQKMIGWGGRGKKFVNFFKTPLFLEFWTKLLFWYLIICKMSSRIQFWKMKIWYRVFVKIDFLATNLRKRPHAQFWPNMLILRKPYIKFSY